MLEKVTILWNGGWDEYEVDVSQQIDDDADVHRWSPCIGPYGSYLRTSFDHSLKERFPNKAVLICRHIGGGD